MRIDPQPTAEEAAPPEEEEEAAGEEEEEPWVARAKAIFTDSDWEEVGECEGEEEEAIEAHNAHVQEVLAQREQKLAAANELLEEAEARSANGDADAEEAEEADDEEADDEEAGEEEEEEQGEEQAAAGHGLAEGAERMTLEDVPEEFVTTYSRKTYGVPDRAIVLKGSDALEFETADKMNAMLVSKSPKPFIALLRTRYMFVLCSDERRLPPGGVVIDGECNGKKLEEYPYETFLYIRCYVKPDPNDPQSVTRAEHDKRRLRHLTKAVALGVHKSFMNLEILKNNPQRREALQPLIDWKPVVDPQVMPKVAKWPRYELELQTAYKEKEPTPRKLGPNSKKSGAAEPARPPTKAAAAKRKQAGSAVVSMDGDDDDDASGHTEDAPGTLEATDVAKRVRYFSVEDGAKTRVFIVGNAVGIIEHH